MTVADFIAQYAFVVLGVLAVAFRDTWPMLGNGNVEPVIRQEARSLDAFEAKIILSRIGQASRLSVSVFNGAKK